MDTIKIENTIVSGNITNALIEDEALLETNNNIELKGLDNSESELSTQVMKSEISVDFEDVENQQTIQDCLNSKLEGSGNKILNKMLDLIGEGSSVDCIVRLCLILEKESAVPAEYSILINNILTSSLSDNILGSLLKFMGRGGSMDGSIRLELLIQNLEIKAKFDEFILSLKPTEVQALVKDLLSELSKKPTTDESLKEITNSILAQIINDPGKLLMLINKLTPTQLEIILESMPDLKAAIAMLTAVLQSDSPEKAECALKLLQSLLQNNVSIKELLSNNPQLLTLLTGSNINILMKLESSQTDTELIANITAILNMENKEKKENNFKINILLSKYMSKKSTQNRKYIEQPVEETSKAES